VRVVEAYRARQDAEPHRLNLGPARLAGVTPPLLDLNKKLMRLCTEMPIAAGFGANTEDVQAVCGWDWGPMLVAGHIGANSDLRRRSTGSPDAAERCFFFYNGVERSRPECWCQSVDRAGQRATDWRVAGDRFCLAPTPPLVAGGARWGAPGSKQHGSRCGSSAVISNARPVAGRKIGLGARRAAHPARLTSSAATAAAEATVFDIQSEPAVDRMRFGITRARRQRYQDLVQEVASNGARVRSFVVIEENGRAFGAAPEPRAWKGCGAA